ncbi:MAG: hypothetical protein QXT13_07655 [Pyrobaculum sp.]
MRVRIRKDEDYIRFLDRFCNTKILSCRDVAFVVDGVLVSDRPRYWNIFMRYEVTPLRSLPDGVLPEGFVEYFIERLRGEIYAYHVDAKFDNGARRSAYLVVALSDSMPYSNSKDESVRKIAYAIAYKRMNELINRFPQLSGYVRVITEARRRRLVRLAVRYVKYIDKQGELPKFCSTDRSDELEMSMLSRVERIDVTDDVVLRYVGEENVTNIDDVEMQKIDKIMRKVANSYDGLRLSRKTKLLRYSLLLNDVEIGETYAYEMQYTFSVAYDNTSVNLADVFCHITKELKGVNYTWRYDRQGKRRKLYITIAETTQLRKDLELVLKNNN